MRFVLVDRLVEIEPGRRARAEKRFVAGEELFVDHFPGLPVVPGVLLTEAMGQTGGWLLAVTLGDARWPLLTMVERAKFRRLVHPGEVIRLDAELRGSHGDDYEIIAQASVDGQRVADARFLFHAFTFSLPAAETERFQAWARETFLSLGGPSVVTGRSPSV